ncbi:Na(+)/citrate cotransporter isoform X2 [Monodelphis domestica]|uniref:Na(+)/citrate cotransporter isoform X2 n=1 Tax=Monodelphis domestica TaxID=13616 RepID=UPI0024E25598|nr:Na(+)/citrate cotransporter isoform X2 [Monodelphis domestica]
MGETLRWLKKFQSALILFGTPLLLLPSVFFFHQKMVRCGFVIILMAVYWCTEVIPLPVTSLFPALLFPLFKVMEAKQVCVQYMKDTTMLFLGSLIVAVAVEHWNIHKRIALRTLLLVGVAPGLLMMGFMSITAFLSMWISNTASTSMMVPIVEAVLEELRLIEDEDLGCASPGTVELLVKDDPESQASLDQASVWTSSRTGPEQTFAATEGEGPGDRGDRKAEKMMERKKTAKALTLCICYAATIGGTGTLTGTGPNVVLAGQMYSLFPNNGDVINFASWMSFAFPNMVFMLLFSWVWLQVLFVGTDFKKNIGIGARKTGKDSTMYNMLQREYQKLGALSYAEVSVLISFLILILLWFFRSPGFIPGWQSLLWMDGKKRYVSDSTVVIFISILLFILPSKRPKFNFRNQVEEEWQVPFYPPPLLTWKVAQKKVPWGIVLLLGGGFAVAKGCEVSGLSEWFGTQMKPLGRMSPAVLSTLVTLLIAVCTEYTSNVATATLFLPILASVAQNISINPLYVMIPCTLGSSFAFMLPVATPPNAIVFSYGRLKVSDMVKAGLVMNMIALFSCGIALNTWGRIIFDLDNFPSWANTTKGNRND